MRDIKRGKWIFIEATVRRQVEIASPIWARSPFHVSPDFCEVISQLFLGPVSWDTVVSFSCCYGNGTSVRLFPLKIKIKKQNQIPLSVNKNYDQVQSSTFLTWGAGPETGYKIFISTKHLDKKNQLQIVEVYSNTWETDNQFLGGMAIKSSSLVTSNL